jgi:hypothetical protein
MSNVKAPARPQGRARKKTTAAAARSAVSGDIRDYADALARVARECCHQRDRYARVVEHGRLELEERLANDVCRVSDAALTQVLDAYAGAVATAASHADEPWIPPANALWLAAREFTRRMKGADTIARRSPRHSADAFGALQAEFELDASAVLALRHACDNYLRVRPEVV